MSSTGTSVTLSFPPFTRAIKILIALNAGIFFSLMLVSALGFRFQAAMFTQVFWLVPSKVVGGYVYQLLTYGFLHEGFKHLLFNMFSLWMFGSMLETAWGSRKFWEFYLFGVIGAGITTVVVAYTFGNIVHLSPETATLGASGGIYAILMAAAMLFGNREVLVFLVLSMKLKYMVAIVAFIALVSALGEAGGTANVAHLGGLLFGYLFVKFVPRQGISFGVSESLFAGRNWYHRWQRQRAAKKFQVYMRKHEDGPKRFFPEDHDKDKKDDPWVN
jgi:membrane associated rhomboid family serine protease